MYSTVDLFFSQTNAIAKLHMTSITFMAEEVSPKSALHCSLPDFRTKASGAEEVTPESRSLSPEDALSIVVENSAKVVMDAFLEPYFESTTKVVRLFSSDDVDSYFLLNLHVSERPETVKCVAGGA